MKDIFPFFVLAIPLLAIAAGMFSRWMRFREKELQHQSALTAEKAAQYAAHTERLEHRVRVLERIITDRGVDLAGEIESLRERPIN